MNVFKYLGHHLENTATNGKLQMVLADMPIPRYRSRSVPECDCFLF